MGTNTVFGFLSITISPDVQYQQSESVSTTRFVFFHHVTGNLISEFRHGHFLFLPFGSGLLLPEQYVRPGGVRQPSAKFQFWILKSRTKGELAFHSSISLYINGA